MSPVEAKGANYQKLGMVISIVMCERLSITDPRIIDLCGEIVEAQKREIDEMKELLARR